MNGMAMNSLTTTAVVGALFAILAARPVSAQETLRACYVPNTGVVYRIGTEDTAEECRTDRHVEFSWTDGAGADHGALDGLEDDDHPQYVQANEVPSAWAGFEMVDIQSSFGVSAGSSVTVGTSASCPTGKIVINGGYFVVATRGVETMLVSNGPQNDGTRWAVRFRVTNSSAESQTVILQVSALCVNAPNGS